MLQRWCALLHNFNGGSPGAIGHLIFCTKNSLRKRRNRPVESAAFQTLSVPLCMARHGERACSTRTWELNAFIILHNNYADCPKKNAAPIIQTIIECPIDTFAKQSSISRADWGSNRLASSGISWTAISRGVHKVSATGQQLALLPAHIYPFGKVDF